MRRQPIFAAESHELVTGGNGSEAVALFPVQQEQVKRLVQSASLLPAAPVVSRDLSSQYGAGASQYAEEELFWWETLGQQAVAAVKARDWAEAEVQTLASIASRPDWHKGYLCLSTVRSKRGDRDGALAALEEGLAKCSRDQAQVELEAAIAKLQSVLSKPHVAGAKEAAAPSSTPLPPEAGPPPSTGNTTAGPAAASATENSHAGPATSSLPVPSRPKSSLKHLPRVVVLMGLPGAGKSTFAQSLAESDASWVRVSQDEIGSRRGVEEMIGRLSGDKGARIILDRCNVEQKDRKFLVDLMMLPRTERVVCVYFEVANPEECERRVGARADHPSIPFGGGKSAVRSMAKALQAPSLSEAYLHEIVTIRSFEEGHELLHKWGASPPSEVPERGLCKFPRTHHVVNTGGSAVTRDDLVMTSGELGRFVGQGHEVIAEEKVDGSNLGFSITRDYEIRAQNRSHYVCSNSHSQFKGLDAWLSEHSWALCQLLVPEVEILFGEWVYARHSVPYTRLPGYFIAFDIYNKRTSKFASVDERNRRLEGLDIPIVPLLARQVFASKEELLGLLEARSAFYDGPVEGAYLRVDGTGEEGAALHNAFRGKIVRSDFIQGIKEHWQSRNVEKNGLAC